MKNKDQIRRFGYLIENQDKTLDITVFPKIWDVAVMDEFEKITDVIFLVQPIMIAFEAVELNYENLRSTTENFVAGLNQASGQIRNVASVGLDGLISVTQAVTNCLASASAFLTLTETRLGKVFGPESDELQRWNKTRRDEFSGHFSYRFVYELRNYSQHYGLPISDLHIKGERSGSDSLMSFDLGMTLSKKELLSKAYNWKKALKAEIEAQSPDFDLQPLMEEYMISLRRLCLSSFELFTDRIDRCDEYFSAITRIFAVPENAMPALFFCDAELSHQAPNRHEQFPVVPFTKILKRRTILIDSFRKMDLC